MREILYKKRQSLAKRRKVISICESSQEKEYKTRVKKNFIYLVTKERQINPQLAEPHIYVTKQINSKKKEEKFFFRVKGAFYMAQEDCLYKVDFRHSLNILIQWNKDFSPKKSATLT
ncbi:MAG: hypothetical protein A2Z88_02870 [Omnitrophica WOR_2 bacterium GWA2_47_8]|nr:MAG: hypothetical protein A2Z88_02870 [Omnitrophica WOR_2 bacterium GWA2_47_8]